MMLKLSEEVKSDRSGIVVPVLLNGGQSNVEIVIRKVELPEIPGGESWVRGWKIVADEIVDRLNLKRSPL